MFFLAGGVYSNNSSIDTSPECLINFLRDKGIDREIFNKTERVQTLSDACLRRMTSERDAVFLQSTQSYEKKKDFVRNLECFVDSIKNNEKFLLLQMERKAVESVKMSWKSKLNPKNWISSDKKKALKAVDAELSKIELPNLFDCEYTEKLGRAFDDQVDRKFTIGNPESTIDNVCMRNYIQKTQKSKQLTHEIAEDCDEVETKLKTIVRYFLEILFANKKSSLQKCIADQTSTDDVFSPFFYIESFYPIVVKDRENEKKKFVNELMRPHKRAYLKCIE